MTPIGTIPGPRAVPALDPMLAQIRLAADPLGRMTDLFRKWGAPVALIRGGGGRVFSGDPGCPGVVFVCGRELVRQVELDHERLHRSALSGQLTPTIPVTERKQAILEWGTGLFAVNGDKHRRQRRLVAEFLSTARVRRYFRDMVGETAWMLDRWRAGETIDVHKELMDVTVRVSARALLGLGIDAGQEIVRAGAESLRLVLSPRVLIAPWDVPGLPYRRFLEAVRRFNSLLRALVAERRREGLGGDVLSALIRSCDEDGGLTEAEVIGHASVIYAASHETTGNALTWMVFLLSQHPRWHKEVVEEVRDVVTEKEPTLEQLSKLVVLESIVKEGLRLLPAAPWTTRIAAAETELGGYRVARGTEVVVSIYHTNREESFYSEPGRFSPGRWKTIEPDVFQFNAFSAGPRACVGRAFATLEIKTILAMILKRWRLELRPGQRVDPRLNITMAPARGLRMAPFEDLAFERGAGEVRGSVRRMVELPGARGH